AAGLPTIATRGDVLADLVGERGLGAVVDFGNVGGWVEAILELLDDPRRYEQARTATIAVRDDFAWPTVTRTLVRLIDGEGGRIRPSKGTGRMVAARLALGGGEGAGDP